jgi:hypothetical protein
MFRTSGSLLAAALLAGGAALPARSGEKPPAGRDVAAWVDQRVKDWQPSADERRIDDIAWVKDIREALRLAREHNRPVFLFTLDGRMEIGRC